MGESRKDWMVLVSVVLALGGCKPGEGDSATQTDGGDGTTVVSECPDPDADNVSYISDDVEICSRVRFGCEVGEIFNNKCGCGCIAPEGVGTTACGSWHGDTCRDDQYCKYPQAQSCGIFDTPGACLTIPEACTTQHDPVCGCDGQTYSNACVAASDGVSIAAYGSCEDTTPIACGGRLGDTCPDDAFCSFSMQATCGWADAPGVCRSIPQAEGCSLHYNPVCGCDNVTYRNACLAASHGVAALSAGPCPDEAPTACGARLGDTCDGDEFCSFTPQAICGFADAPGTCEPRPELCTLQHAPVCGCDHLTYPNECAANSAGVSVQYVGPCTSASGVEGP